MILLLLLCALPVDHIAREECDRITVSAFYDDEARLVFEQLLFHDWNPHEARWDLRAWRMVKRIEATKEHGPSQGNLPRLNQATGQYECHWMDGEVERIVTAPVLKWMQTQYDPELEERAELPKEKRRELRSPKTLLKRGR